MEKILKLSYDGLQVFAMLVNMYNKRFSATIFVANMLKDFTRNILIEDYEEFSFIRILSDNVDKSPEEFLEVIDIAIQDLVASIKLGEL